MKFDCPYCDQNLQCPDDLIGTQVKCPTCNQKITVPDFEEPSPEQSPSTTSTGKRKIKVQAKGRTAASTLASTPRSGSPRAEAKEDPTNVPMLKALMIGVGVGVLWYILLLPFSNSFIYALFLKRGWVPFALTLLTGWSSGILFLKYLKLKKQSQAILLDVLPDAIAEDITPDNVPAFISHVRSLPGRVQSSFMVKRMRLGLEHFQVRKSNPEVASVMTVQSDIDGGSVQSSYAMLKVFLWAIPILGFIGTVMGISDAVGGFSGSLEDAQDMEVLKASLNDVTGGLSVAFDTTLVALVLSLLISFPASAMQKAEEEMLGEVDAACNENLLKRLNDAGGLADVAINTQAIMQSVGAAVSGNQQEVLDNFRAVQEDIKETIIAQQEMLDAVAKAVADQMKAMEDRSQQHQKALEGSLTLLTGPYESTLKKVAEQSQVAGKEGADSLRRQAEAVETASQKMVEGLTHLNAVLKELGGQQIVIKKQGGIWPFRK